MFEQQHLNSFLWLLHPVLFLWPCWQVLFFCFYLSTGCSWRSWFPWFWWPSWSQGKFRTQTHTPGYAQFNIAITNILSISSPPFPDRHRVPQVSEVPLVLLDQKVQLVSLVALVSLVCPVQRWDFLQWTVTDFTSSPWWPSSTALQGMTGSPGSPGPDGKTGPAVSSCPSCSFLVCRLLISSLCSNLDFLLNPDNREPLDKMAALDPLALLELEVSLESWASQDPRELLWVQFQLLWVGLIDWSNQWDTQVPHNLCAVFSLRVTLESLVKEESWDPLALLWVVLLFSLVCILFLISFKSNSDFLSENAFLPLGCPWKGWWFWSSGSFWTFCKCTVPSMLLNSVGVVRINIVWPSLGPRWWARRTRTCWCSWLPGTSRASRCHWWAWQAWRAGIS